MIAASLLLVLSNAESTLSLVDTTTNKVVGKLPTGLNPHEVVTTKDGTRAYVADYGNQRPGSTITILDLVERKPIKTLSLEGLTRPHGILEWDGLIYFTAEANETVARYNPKTDKLDWQAKTGQKTSHMLVMAPDGKTIYTANVMSDTISAIELPSGKATPIPVGKGPEGIAMAPDGKTVWVANRTEGTVFLIDTATRKVVKTLPTGRMPIRIAFTPDGKLALVADPAVGELHLFDAEKRERSATIPVAPTPMSIVTAPDNTTAYIALRGNATVAIIDLKICKVTGTISGVGGTPDGMAWANTAQR